MLASGAIARASSTVIAANPRFQNAGNVAVFSGEIMAFDARIVALTTFIRFHRD